MSTFYKSGGSGSVESWKDPVADVASLPASDNTTGDIRQTLDSGDLHRWNGSSWDLYYDESSSGGDVVGPASSVDNDIATFDGTTGKLIKNGGQTIAEVIADAVSQSGDVDGPASSSDNALTRFDSTTGKLIQDSTSHLDDDGDLRLGSDSAPDASAILDLTSTTKGLLPPPMTTAQRDAISSPATGLQIYNTTDDEMQNYDGSSWVSMGGSEPVPTEFISGDDRNFENSIGDWATYADAAGVAPVDGTGGTSGITFTRQDSSPLAGTASAQLGKPPSNQQGSGASLSDIAIPEMYRGRPYKVRFGYKDVGGSMNKGDVIIYAYDQSNSELMGRVFNGDDAELYDPNSEGQIFEGIVYPKSNTANIRLIIHIASTGTNNFTLYFDEMQMFWEPLVSLPETTQFSARIDASAASVASQGPLDWIDSITDNGAGNFTINFKSGIFSEAPAITLGGDTITGDGNIYYQSLTDSSVTVRTFDNAVATDFDFSIVASRQSAITTEAISLSGGLQFEEKILSADVTTNGATITDYTISNLVVGKRYHVAGPQRMLAAVSDADFYILAKHDGSTVGQVGFGAQAGASGGQVGSPNFDFYFTATTTSLTFVTDSLAAGSDLRGNGTKDESFIQVQEVPFSQTALLTQGKKAYVSYSVSNNTTGGSATATTWTARPLNTIDSDPFSILSSAISSNQFSLPAGTYSTDAIAAFFRTRESKIRLYNVTDSVAVLTGLSVFAPNDTTFNGAATAPLKGQFTISSEKTFRFEYYIIDTAGGTSALGDPVNAGDSEVYFQAEITKVR